MVKLYFKLILFASIATASCLQGMKKGFNFKGFTKGMKNGFNPKRMNKRMNNFYPKHIETTYKENPLFRTNQNPLLTPKVKHKMRQLFDIPGMYKLVGERIQDIPRSFEILKRHKGTRGRKMRLFNRLKRDALDTLGNVESFMGPSSTIDGLRKDLKGLKLNNIIKER